MWPTRNDGSYPSYCNNQNFDPSPLESILQDLIVAWYSSHQVHFINFIGTITMVQMTTILSGATNSPSTELVPKKSAL